MTARSTAALLLAAGAATLLLPAQAAPQASDQPLRELWSQYPLTLAETDGRPPADAEGPEKQAEPLSDPAPSASQGGAEPADESTFASTNTLILLGAVAAVGAVLLAILPMVGRRPALPVVGLPARLLPSALRVASGVRRHGSKRPRERSTRTPAAPRHASRLAAGPAPEAERPRPADARMSALLADGQTEYCVIGWWRGYVKAQVLAVVLRSDGGHHVAAMSPMFRWRAAAPPSSEPGSGPVWKAYEALLDELESGGWEWVEPGEPFPNVASRSGGLWYELRFRRRVPLSLGALAEQLNDPRRKRSGV
jgi:hypothetical protein